MRAFLSIVVGVAFLSASSGAVSGSPVSIPLARDIVERTSGISPTLRGPRSQRSESRKVDRDVVLHSFGNGTDGENPYSGLIYANGVFYGTTPQGGTNGRGTIFEVTASGAERVLYSFADGADGQRPYAGLLYENGVLYGTTFLGGTHNDGTVFEVTTSGAESVLHSFAGGTDGKNPFGGLVYVNGMLYGTTVSGGKFESRYDGGTVFEMTTSGAERVLHNFGAKVTDGNSIYAGLLYVNGVFYGTAYSGGKYGAGTVYEMTVGGTVTILHSFNPNNGVDGAHPSYGLTYANGTLFGTTPIGGGKKNDGTIFEVTPAGTEIVLHVFDGDDGASPEACLVVANGNVYGTTSAGGELGVGTVFELTASGTVTVLTSLESGANGSPKPAGPQGVLVYENGLLYGTTLFGGKYDGVKGSYGGTIFEVSP